MKRVKHLLSEPAEWITKSEFVDKDGNITTAIGETKIIIESEKIRNETWTCIDGKKIQNFYSIKRGNENRFSFISDNQMLGKQYGEFNVYKNVVFSKYSIDKTGMCGFEIIIKEEDECSVFGTLYNGDEMVHSWKTVMVRI